jgi:uncharacterized membrane-anchored protein YhcB (DUF1043 family)
MSQEMMLDWMPVALIAFPLVAFAIGILIGRRSAADAERARMLTAELDAQRGALERVQGEKLALEAEVRRARDDAESYRGKVVDHFYGTSEQLRALTLRYRELFVHLADGARELCPEASSALEAGLQPPALASDATPVVESEPAPTPEAEEPTLTSEPARGTVPA